MLIASASVGQEGLDFHQYRHAVVHWNLPSNPVDLEQREGRVHRYKCHAVRKNLAKVFRDKLVPVQKRLFSAILASICEFPCAAYGSTPPRKPLIS